MTAAPSRACTVVIVNYNAGDHLARSLASLAPSLDGWRWQAIVVDNASQDGSARHALTSDQRVQLVRVEKNVGFGAGVNRGAAAAAAAGAAPAPDMPGTPNVPDAPDPLILLLNPDAELTPGVVDALAAELDRHPECAIIGPGILNEDGSVQGSARGDPTLLTGLFGRTGPFTRLFPGSSMARRDIVSPEDLPPGHCSLEVDWISGACMLLRRDAFDEVGGFDAGYFLYWEDADLCRRLRQRGRTIRYYPGVRVRHAVGVSSSTARRASIRAFHESALRYYNRYVARSAPQRWLAAALLRTRAAFKQWGNS